MPQSRTRLPRSGTWAERLSTQVGVNIRAARNRIGISEQQLSKRLTNLGNPIARTTINQIENGLRSISLPETLVFAVALGVPPVELIYDPEARNVEILPGNFEMSGDEAVEWLSGAVPVREPGQTKEEWLSNSVDPHISDAAEAWITLGRFERRAYQLLRDLEETQRLLISARDKTERSHRANNINYITRRGKGLVAHLLRQVAIVRQYLPDFDLDDETKATMQKIQDLPNVTAA
ncbi:MAG: helix-turn-helix transcriptional regulator [Propionibacteriaceae bacterium]|jgi:transcriptional regulator with XRE-family HTH domain|nr:helix-turn-helix transcriptional regulator [Propionibacteriaceae bacterium]